MIAFAHDNKDLGHTTQENILEGIKKISEKHPDLKIATPGPAAHDAYIRHLPHRINSQEIPEIFAKHALLESKNFMSTLHVMTKDFMKDKPRDAALAAIRNTVYTNTALSLGSSLAGTAAGIGATISSTGIAAPVAPIVTAAVQFASMEVLGKLARATTHYIHQQSNNKAALTTALTRMADVGNKLPTVDDISNNIISNFPKLNTLQEQLTNRLISKHVQDALVEISENRLQIGRQLVLQLLPDNEESTKKFLNRELSFAKMAYYRQRVDDLKAIKNEIDGVNKLLNKTESELSELHPRLRESSVIKSAYKAYNKALDKFKDYEKASHRDSVDLIQQMFSNLAQKGWKISEEEFLNIQAAFLFPSGDKRIKNILESYRHQNDIDNLNSEKKHFPENIHNHINKCQKKIVKLESNIHHLMNDHLNYVSGNIEKVEDRFDIYKNLNKDYYTSMLMFEKNLTPGGASGMRVGGRLLGSTPQLLAVAAGALATPYISVSHAGQIIDGVKSKYDMTDKFINQSFQTTMNGLNIGALATFSRGGNSNFEYTAGNGDFLSTVIELGPGGFKKFETNSIKKDLENLLKISSGSATGEETKSIKSKYGDKFFSATEKRDSAHREFPKKYPVEHLSDEIPILRSIPKLSMQFKNQASSTSPDEITIPSPFVPLKMPALPVPSIHFKKIGIEKDLSAIISENEPIMAGRLGRELKAIRKDIWKGIQATIYAHHSASKIDSKIIAAELRAAHHDLKKIRDHINDPNVIVTHL